MEIDVTKLIEMVTAQVIGELKTRGVRINHSASFPGQFQSLQTKSEKIEMDKYCSPILTENHIRRLHELTGEIIIPKGTVITPKARELVKEKRLLITYNS